MFYNGEDNVVELVKLGSHALLKYLTKLNTFLDFYDRYNYKKLYYQ